MTRINEDNLKPLRATVFANPVRVEDFEVGEFSGGSFFAYESDAFGWFELLNSHAFGSSACFWSDFAHSASSDADAGHYVALLGFVSESPGFVYSRGMLYSSDNGLLTPFHKSLTHQSVHVRLFGLGPCFSNVLVCHTCSRLRLFAVQPFGIIPADKLVRLQL